MSTATPAAGATLYLALHGTGGQKDTLIRKDHITCPTLVQLIMMKFVSYCDVLRYLQFMAKIIMEVVLSNSTYK